MAHDYIDINTLKFLLYEVHSGDEILNGERYAMHDHDAMNMMIESVRDFCDAELFPFIKEFDVKPARYEDGSIKIHPQLGKAYKQGAELGMIAGSFEEKEGGFQLPRLFFSAMHMIANAANNHVPGYWGLTMGSADLIATFGSEDLKQTFLPNMLSGKWQGTMCLTEPQAGSSLSDVITRAQPTDDDHYLIQGQKIFISAGDHEYADNVVHLLLARIEGAPEGTRGISLFVVPKKRGDSLDNNDVITASEFEKMGQKGYCTTHLLFGEQDNCHGYLVGEPHQGLKYMFKMMNAARIDVGLGAAAIASAAYYASLNYAKERPQGRRVMDSGKKDVAQEQVLITQHPDVRRLLYLQKGIAEGGMSLVLQASEYVDKLRIATTDDEKNKWQLLLEILTPMVKTYPSEAGKRSTDAAVQVLGGYGFLMDYTPQQFYRDIRIFSLYEGTTGIQSLDLLGRKITMNDGAATKLLMEEIMKTINRANQYDELLTYTVQLQDALAHVQLVVKHLMQFAQQGQFERFTADASIFMEFLSTVVVAWQWLKIGIAASQNGIEEQTEFYQSKIHCMKFFFRYELPATKGLYDTLLRENSLTIVGDGPDPS
ncbi:MAG: acyl-CoA dehydrogenase [Cyclobacteriaceae bacterium]